MVFKIDDIARDVRVALDYNHSCEALLKEEDPDTLSLEEIVRSKVKEAVRRVHLQAPSYMLEGGHTFGDSLFRGDQGSGAVLLPDDFLRLVVFRMSDWERAVYSAISTDDGEYARQSSRFKGIRGTAQRPVCAIAIRPEGRVLEYYSCRSDEATVAQGVYIPEPRIDSRGGIDISERCYTAVIYMIAGLVLLATGESERGAAMVELSKAELA